MSGHNNTATNLLCINDSTTNASRNNSNETFQHQETKGTLREKWTIQQNLFYMVTEIPYDVKLTKADNETYFGLKIVKIENDHFICTIS
jgi:hypothetical protein